jgi:hypothetical protein
VLDYLVFWGSVGVLIAIFGFYKIGSAAKRTLDGPTGRKIAGTIIERTIENILR